MNKRIPTIDARARIIRQRQLSGGPAPPALFDAPPREHGLITGNAALDRHTNAGVTAKSASDKLNFSL
jgi:hypothetical protein